MYINFMIFYRNKNERKKPQRVSDVNIRAAVKEKSKEVVDSTCVPGFFTKNKTIFNICYLRKLRGYIQPRTSKLMIQCPFTPCIKVLHQQGSMCSHLRDVHSISPQKAKALALKAQNTTIRNNIKSYYHRKGNI